MVMELQQELPDAKLIYASASRISCRDEHVVRGMEKRQQITVLGETFMNSFVNKSDKMEKESSPLHAEKKGSEEESQPTKITSDEEQKDVAKTSACQEKRPSEEEEADVRLYIYVYVVIDLLPRVRNRKYINNNKFERIHLLLNPYIMLGIGGDVFDV